jgi:glycosyltransferase involved in cell wall biosynthesis
MHSTRPFFSIVIPVYGTEPFVEQCLRSVQDQTFTDFECWLINDDSPGVDLQKWTKIVGFERKVPVEKLQKIGQKDQLQTIFEQTVGNDARFKFLTKPNGGVGSARNLGLEKATGQFYVVVDSDDFLSLDFLEVAARELGQKKPNQILYGDLKTFTDGQIGQFRDIVKFLPRPNTLATMLSFPTWTLTPINYFWSIDFLRKYEIKYPTIRAEDSFFIIDACLAMEKEFGKVDYKQIPAVYFYRQFPDQVTRSQDYEIKLFACMIQLMRERVGELTKFKLVYGVLARLYIWRFSLYRQRHLTNSKLLKTVFGMAAKVLSLISVGLSGARNS